MRVLVDGRPLSTWSSTRGIGRYVRRMLEALVAVPDLDIQALVSGGGDALPDRVEPVVVRRTAPRGLLFLEQGLRMPRDIAAARPDVFWSTSNDPPRHPRVPWVQTAHDVIPLTFRQRRSSYQRAVWRVRGRWMASASAVVAISESSAAEMTARLPLDPARVRVAYPGVDSAFRPPMSRVEPDPPFVLVVAGYGPHKGYAEASAVIALLAEMGFPHRLNIAGAIGPGGRAAVESTVRRAGSRDHVELLGFVSDAELIDLYQSASLLAVTSRSEGFCLPAIEAMACGLPVVAFDNSAIPEAVGNAGVLVRDGDVTAFATAAADLLSDSVAWRARAEAGLQRSQQFSWNASAASYAAVFRELVG